MAPLRYLRSLSLLYGALPRVRAGISGGFGFCVMVLSCGKPRKRGSLIEFFDGHFVIGKSISLMDERLVRRMAVCLIFPLIKA